jgi:hypothetical protein
MPYITFPSTADTSLSSTFGSWAGLSPANNTGPDSLPTYRWSTFTQKLALRPSTTSVGLDSFGDSTWSAGAAWRVDLEVINSPGYRGTVSITAGSYATHGPAYYIRTDWHWWGAISSLTAQATPIYGCPFIRWRINSPAGSTYSTSNPVTVFASDVNSIGINTLYAEFGSGCTANDSSGDLCSGPGGNSCSYYTSYDTEIWPASGSNWSNTATFWANAARTIPFNGGGNWWSHLGNNFINRISSTGTLVTRIFRPNDCS